MRPLKLLIILIILYITIPAVYCAEDGDYLLFTPYANELVTERDVTVKEFNPNKGLEYLEYKRTFTEIDPNLWIREYLRSISDTLLKYQKGIKIIDTKFSENNYILLLKIKEILEKLLLNRFQSILLNSTISSEEVKKLVPKIKKILKNNLSDAYDNQKFLLHQGLVLNSDLCPKSFYPEIPELEKHTVLPYNFSDVSIQDTKKYTLKVDLKNWNYSSDELELLVIFDGKWFPEKPESRKFNMKLFNELASHTVSYPSIKKIFETEFPKLNRRNRTKTLARLRKALKVFTQLTQKVLNQIKHIELEKKGDLVTIFSEDSLRYTIRDMPFKKHIKPLLLTIIESGAKHDLSRIKPEIKGYSTIDGPVQNSYLYKNSKGKYLQWGKEKKLIERSLNIKKLDLLKHYRVNAGVRILRNYWFDEKLTKPAFKYSTDFIKFNEPVAPSLDLDQHIEIGKIQKSKIRKVTLGRSLKNFLQSIFKGSAKGSFMLQLEVYAENQIKDTPLTNDLPIYIGYNIMHIEKADTELSKKLWDYSKNVAQKIVEWIESNDKLGNTVTYKFNLKLLTNQRDDDKLLIHWKKLKIIILKNNEKKQNKK